MPTIEAAPPSGAPTSRATRGWSRRCSARGRHPTGGTATARPRSTSRRTRSGEACRRCADARRLKGAEVGGDGLEILVGVGLDDRRHPRVVGPLLGLEVVQRLPEVGLLLTRQPGGRAGAEVAFHVAGGAAGRTVGARGYRRLLGRGRLLQARP